MNQDIEGGLRALEYAKDAYRQGNAREARRWAEQAVSLAADQEEPWLWLAVLSSPRASLAYLNRALEINPQSQAARKGMHWAIRRLRASWEGQKPLRRIIDPSITSDNFIRPRPRFYATPLPWILVLLLVCSLLTTWFILPSPAFSQVVNRLPFFAHVDPVALARDSLSKATRTPTATFTQTQTPTFTPTPTFTQTPTYTPTPTFTETPVPTDTPTRRPTRTRRPTATEQPPAIPSMPDVGLHEHWVDVNLSLQTAYAMEGQQLVREFIVSTGTWQHPTVTGEYHIYVKYRYADMAGPGYYLPDVPFVMYFYRGYGLHGTYWHNNFGTPMSHGCVNFSIEDAGWLFDFADVGTLVNVHY